MRCVGTLWAATVARTTRLPISRCEPSFVAFQRRNRAPMFVEKQPVDASCKWSLKLPKLEATVTE
jgi:hypothetical protein